MAGLIDALARHWNVKDYGDVSFVAPSSERGCSGIIAESSLISMIHTVHLAVTRSLEEGRLPIVLGGDCPVLLGCLAAARSVATANRLGLLFVDGHEDAYLPHQSTTGEAADMELGLAIGRVTPGISQELVDLLPLVDPADVSLLGIRDKAILQAEGVPSIASEFLSYNDAALIAGNIERFTRDALQHVRLHTDRWWLHVDLDVLSTEALPAVDYLQPGGLSWSQLTTLTTTALTTSGLVGMDVTIYNPDLDPDRVYARRIIDYLSLLAPEHN
jgi:arginase